MILNLLRLRFLQGFRIILETGPGIILIALIITLGLSLKMLEAIVEWPPKNMAFLGMFIILAVHFSRNDLRFLTQIFSNTFQVNGFLFFEYTLLLSPLIILFLVLANWTNVLILSLLPAISFFLPTKNIKWKNTNFKKDFSMISLDTFELKFQIEKYWIGVIVFFLLSLFSFLHISVFILSMLIIMVIIGAAFKSSETKEMLHWHPRFLWRKIGKNLLLISILLLPLITVSGIVHFSFRWVILYGICCVITILVFSILFKYSRINPLYQVEHDTMAAALYFLFLLLPGGILITIGYSVFLYFKARKNLLRFYA